ncbi:hypothetical protein EC957_011853 [Mortierella hygrophila]|uniref:Uncharacterized protein n=1 Tax=Mortierella hygrophila TaxID=979708 RepID=A0A9P6EW08_9FUNG|nr:hypothetical protein EC957_011853 [Mortierella hygrophila]
MSATQSSFHVSDTSSFHVSDTSSFHVSDTSSDDMSPPPLFLLPVSDERRRKITLDELPGMAGAAPGIEFEAMNGGLIDDMFIGEDDGLYIDAEGSLRADMLEQGFVIQGDVSIFSGFPDTPATARALGKHPREESALSERIVP